MNKPKVRMEEYGNETEQNTQPEPVKTEQNVIFHKVDGIPTDYRLYPAGTVIQARPLNVLEVKKLSTMNEHNVEYVINEILKRTVRGIDVNEIFLADKIYLVFWLRANTYKDSGYKIDYFCQHCEQKTGYEFSLDKINVVTLDDEKFEKINNEIELPFSKDKLQFRYLKIADEDKVEKFLSKNKSLEQYDKDILGLCNNLMKINGEEQNSLYQKYNYMIKLHPSDFVYIESFLSHVDIGIDPIIEVECEHCKGGTPVGVTFRKEFFVPSYKF